MSREKQIEEMARVLHQGMKPLKETYATNELSAILYHAGYRKASEVAREIFEEIETAFARVGVLPHNVGLVDFNVLETIKKKYTESEGK